MGAQISSTAYGWLMLAGIFVSIALWSRVARRDERLRVLAAELEKIAEQPVENLDLLLEGGFAIFGERRGVGKQLGKTFTPCATLQNA